MAVFADVQDCISADMVNGWFRKGPEMCSRNLWMVPCQREVENSKNKGKVS